MKRWICLLIIIALFSGCKSKQKLTSQTEFETDKTEQKDIQQTDTSVRDSSGQKSSEIVNNKELETESETVTKITEYDTSKPVNPETGKPPILRESESTTKTKEKGKEGISEKKNEDSHVTDQTGAEKIDKSKTVESGNGSTKSEQSKIKSSFQIPWIWLILGAAVIVSIGYCIKKKINPIKWILRI